MSRSDDDMFDDDRLWDELNGPSRERRRAAIRVLEALGKLALLRTVELRIPYDLVWKRIYDAKLLHRDTQGGDGDALSDAATEARDELGQLIELTRRDHEPPPAAEQKWARGGDQAMRGADPGARAGDQGGTAHRTARP